MQLAARQRPAPAMAAIAVALAIGAAAGQPAIAAGGLPLRTIADIPLPGRTTRFDYQACDPGRHLLFIAHQGDGTVAVVDLRSGKVVADIDGLAAVHGVLAIPEKGRVYASATGARRIAVIDESGFRIIGTIAAGDYPDGLAYAPGAGKVYVSDESGSGEVVIDTETNRRVALIPLGGEAGNSQYDPVSRHVFVNVQDQGELAEIDPATDTIVGRHPLPGARGNHGLLIDPVRHLAFIACEGNDRLLVLNLDTMAVVASHPLGHGPDVLAFDPGPRLLYVASESGVVSMFRDDGRDFRLLARGRVAAHAHSIAVDPETHRVYLPLQDVGGRPVLRVMAPDQSR